MKQNTLRFSVSRLPGETSFNHTHRQRALNVEKAPGRVCPEKLFADLLKRQARRVMADITECPPDTLPAHLARLDGLRELFSHAMHHGLVPMADARRSDSQLLYAYTVADFAACLEITRKTHRAPAFINQRDEDIADIKRMINTLAGCFAHSKALNAVLDEVTDESEVGL